MNRRTRPALSAQADPLENGRPRIAVFTGSLASHYLMNIPLGVADYATSQGYNSVSFAGGPLGSDNPLFHARSTLFELAEPARFDGLIVVSGSLSRFVDAAQMQSFLARFADIPIVCVGSRIEGLSSVMSDNHSGMHALMDHLIVQHGLRRIAFASDPPQHSSSNEKLLAYQEALTRHGIAIDPILIVHGELVRSAPWLDGLLTRPGPRLEAIVAATDLQALAAIESLQQHGLRVPQDIVVTGATGLVEGLFYEPALTTIEEPMQELGRQAARMLIAQIEQGAAPGDMKVPTRLVIRNSCGCDASIEAQTRPHLNSQLPRSLGDALRAAAAESASRHNASPGEYIDALASELDGLAPEQGLHQLFFRLGRCLNQSMGDTEVMRWMHLLPALQRQLALLYSAPEARAQMLTASAQLEQLLASSIQKSLGFRQFESEKYINSFRELGVVLNSNFKREDLCRLLVREIGLNDCHLGVFENSRQQVRNLLSIHAQRLITLSHADSHYPASALMPPSTPPYQEAYALIVLPIAFRSDAIGIMVANLRDRKGALYENLQSLMSSALKNESQIQELKEAEEKFSDIAHSTSDWLWEVDANGHYTYCSGGVINVLGYSAEEMIGRSLFDFLLDSESEYIEHVQQRLMPQHLPLTNLECVNRHKSGREVTLLVSGKPIIKDGAMVGYRGAFKDTTEIKQQENRIRQLAFSDPLTGLPNRTLFHDRLDRVVASARRDSSRFALAFLDLDRFKQVNDSLGHDVGDLLLKEVAARLEKCLREIDTLARLGGDEFTIILPSMAGNEDAAAIARRILRALSEPLELAEQQLFITTSIGIAFYPEDGNSALLLLKSADKAMYQAKEQGKNRFVFYDKGMEAKSQRRMLLEAALHRALPQNNFSLHYQPQVDCISGRIVSAEALLRLADHSLGAISPAEFIPLAEEIGMIDDIGEWVFTQACQQAKLWQEAGHSLRVAVNVSALQLRNPQLAERFSEIIAAHQVSPQNLEIEITENAIIEHEDLARNTLKHLARLGLAIAIDDFGTGYSSLIALRKFPIGTLKIDRSFIHDALSSGDSASIVKAIVSMSRDLNLQVIAEGVETLGQLEFLRSIDCKIAQGYYFSRPLKAASFDALLLRSDLLPLGSQAGPD